MLERELSDPGSRGPAPSDQSCADSQSIDGRMSGLDSSDGVRLHLDGAGRDQDGAGRDQDGAGRDRDGSPGAPDQALSVADLRQLLATLPVIEQAKGVLMGFYGIDADAAFALLVRWSQHTNIKVRTLSTALVTAASAEHPDPFGGVRELLEGRPQPSRKRRNR